MDKIKNRDITKDNTFFINELNYLISDFLDINILFLSMWNDTLGVFSINMFDYVDKDKVINLNKPNSDLNPKAPYNSLTSSCVLYFVSFFAL